MEKTKIPSSMFLCLFFVILLLVPPGETYSEIQLYAALTKQNHPTRAPAMLSDPTVTPVTTTSQDLFYQRYFRKGKQTKEPEEIQKEKQAVEKSRHQSRRRAYSTPIPELAPQEKEIRELIHDLGTDPSHRQTAIERLSILGTPAVPALRQALNNEYKFTRIGALSALAYIRSEAALADIHRCLNDQEPEVRVAAIKALGRMRHQASSTKIAQRLNDSHSHVRQEAVLTLGRMRQSPVARHALIQALKNSDPVVRQQAAQELSSFKGPEVVNALLQATYDPDHETCAYAIRALGEMSATKARTRILALKQSQDPFIRQEATQALQNIPAPP